MKLRYYQSCFIEKNGFIAQIKKVDMESLSELRLLVKREDVKDYQRNNNASNKRRR